MDEPESRVPLTRNPYLWAFAIGCITLTLMRPLLRYEPKPPPVLGQLPEFSLVDTHGKPFGSADLSGRVWIASFFFTSCPSICPLLMTRMASLQQRFQEAGIDAIGLVSITVDPATDTPERLLAAESGYGVDEHRWHLLTGSRDRIAELLTSGFKVPGLDGGAMVDGDIPHSAKVVLVDGAGHIRGYYDTDELGLDEVFHRSQHVLKETAKGAR